MKKPGIIALSILLLGFLLGCSQKDKGSTRDISPQLLLPQLSGLGFKFQEANEIDQAEFSDLAKDAASQFGISISNPDVDEIDLPLRVAIGRYRDDTGAVTIRISQFERRNTAMKELNSHIDNIKKLGRLLRKSKSIIAGESNRLRVNGQKAYWLEYMVKPSSGGKRYECRLIWADGPYLFEINSYGEEPRMITEAVEIAEKIEL